MKIQKLLIAPGQRLVSPKKTHWQQFKNSLRPPARLYDAELLFYGDLPNVLGQHNTFIADGLHEHLHDTNVPADCPYPSCHGTPVGTPVPSHELPDIISQIDAILVSTVSPRVTEIIQLARQRSKPIAMIDFADHEELYGTNPTRQQVYRGFLDGSDFDIYFKKDFSLTIESDKTFPLEPTPVRPASYDFPNLPPTSPIFYSGRSRPEKVQPDRRQTVALVKQHFPEANIIEHDDRSSFLTTSEYWHHLAASRLALSPSGRIWGSFRHAETGLTPHTALIAPKPYIKLTGAPPIDGVNAILYDVEEKKGRYYLKNPAQLVEKIQYYLDHNEQLLALARQWHDDVHETHTIAARSHYILSVMENSF